MADGINQRRNTQVTVLEVRGHYKRLEDEYRTFKELITSEGFFWDMEANVVVATAERWDNYLETHHGPVKFRVKGCAHFSLLERMFSSELLLQPLDVLVALPVQNPIPEAD
ncbi:hypothetical protein CJ030_MR2G020391 [Morella rubra]|uniref:Myb/SANT-like domain-containing protein n=1 Tax=Morella rubra TaxID=262757 RepID=A0A6A1W7M8_9ROSI|nr:hypothetical protein CJ030_MR2G020391 [Morella rubra]